MRRKEEWNWDSTTWQLELMRKAGAEEERKVGSEDVAEKHQRHLSARWQIAHRLAVAATNRIPKPGICSIFPTHHLLYLLKKMQNLVDLFLDALVFKLRTANWDSQLTNTTLLRQQTNTAFFYYPRREAKGGQGRFRGIGGICTWKGRRGRMQRRKEGRRERKRKKKKEEEKEKEEEQAKEIEEEEAARSGDESEDDDDFFSFLLCTR